MSADLTPTPEAWNRLAGRSDETAEWLEMDADYAALPCPSVSVSTVSAKRARSKQPILHCPDCGLLLSERSPDCPKWHPGDPTSIELRHPAPSQEVARAATSGHPEARAVIDAEAFGKSVLYRDAPAPEEDPTDAQERGGLPRRIFALCGNCGCEFTGWQSCPRCHSMVPNDNRAFYDAESVDCALSASEARVAILREIVTENDKLFGEVVAQRDELTQALEDAAEYCEYRHDYHVARWEGLKQVHSLDSPVCQDAAAQATAYGDVAPKLRAALSPPSEDKEPT